MQGSGIIFIVGVVILILIVFAIGKSRGKSQKKKDIRKKLDV